MKKTPAQAKRALQKIEDDLEKPDQLEQQYAQLLMEKAQANAQSRPTAQSALVADSLSVSGNVIRPAAGTPSDVAGGAEYGSDLFPQFQHSHNPAGLWLHPAAEDVQVLKAMDQELDDVIQKAI